MSDVASEVRALPTEPRAAAAPPPALTLAQRQARDAAAREAEASAGRQLPAPPVAGGGGRHWVQIAHGTQRAALALQYRQVRAQAPDLIGGRTAWTAADRGTNRLLMGPFASAEEAEAYIGELGARHVAAILWDSGAGASPERLQGARRLRLQPRADGDTSGRACRPQSSRRPGPRRARGRRLEP